MPIPNAVVILVDTSTNRSQRTVAGADGAFSMSNLTPGTYRVDLEGPSGLRTGERTIQISTGQPTSIEVVFGAPSGAAGDRGTVEIRAMTPLLQTDSAEVARSYETRVIRSLPVLDRHNEEFVGLMPGVTPPVETEDRLMNPQRNRSFHVNGQPDYANVMHQDGAYNYEPFTGTVARVAPYPSIQSLNIRTSNYNAEHGVSGGAWSNTITRPGTNGVHGSLFAFNTNNFFTARNPIVPADVPAPRFTQNQFGGSVGGPLIPDRMFWFISYEGRLRRGRQLNFATVPTADLRAGNFSGISDFTLYDPNGTPFANNRIPAGRISPTSRAILDTLPLPNVDGLSNNLVGNPLYREDYHRADAKLDHRFSDSSVGFLRYGYTPAYIERESLLGVLGDAGTANLRNHSAVASFSHDFGDRLLAEFRMGYHRYRNRLSSFGDAFALNQQLGDVGFTGGLPQINIAGMNPLGLSGAYPSKMVSNIYNPATNWILHTGMHNLKFGVDSRILRSSGFDAGFFSPRGSFQFGPGPTSLQTGMPADMNLFASSFGSFLLGAPTQAGVSSFMETPTHYQTQYGAYITDTIRLWQLLSLELGVRYDVFGPVARRDETGTLLFDAITDRILDDPATFDIGDYDLNNIAPRVGFAFQPVQRLVVRGGYSLQYFPVPFQLSGINQNVLAAQMGVANSFGRTPFMIPTVNMDPDELQNRPFYLSPRRMNTPYLQTFNFMIQGDLPSGFLLDVGYVGNLGRQLPYSRVLNAAMPGTGISGIPGFSDTGITAPLTERNTGLNSNYNSLQANVTKRFQHGLAVSAAYTFSKALDYGFELNPFDTGFSYGLADWDRTHIVSLSHLWQLPFGQGRTHFNSGWTAQLLGNWEINGILRWATGTPFSVTGDPLFCNCPGAGGIRADVSGSIQNDWEGTTNLNPSMFSLPAAGSFGNLGRNAIRGPRLFTYNLSLFRNFQVGENYKLELRGEAYNLTNSSNYVNPVSSIGSPGFGSPMRTFNDIGGRQFQVAARVLF